MKVGFDTNLQRRMSTGFNYQCVICEFSIAIVQPVTEQTLSKTKIIVASMHMSSQIAGSHKIIC